MRTIKELLELMLDNQSSFTTGLCNWVHSLRYLDKMSFEECRLLSKYVRENRPSKFSSIDAWNRRNSGYYWLYGDINPRIKWIKKHINKNK